MIETIDTANFFRPHLAEMIDFCHPLSMPASRLPRSQIKATVAPCFARRVGAARVLEHDDFFGASLQVAGAGFSTAGRPRIPVPLVVSLLLNVPAKLARGWRRNLGLNAVGACQTHQVRPRRMG